MKIFQFLDKNIKIAGQIDVAVQQWKLRKPASLMTKWKGKGKDTTQQIVKSLVSLKDISFDTLPGKAEKDAHMAELQIEVNRLLEPTLWKEPDGNTASIIEALLTKLQNDIYFYTFLHRSQFKGALHCEALLASLCCRQVEHPAVKSVSEEMQVSYVSSLLPELSAILAKGFHCYIWGIEALLPRLRTVSRLVKSGPCHSRRS